MKRPRLRRRGEVCETCSDRLNGQGVIFLDGARRLYLCRVCTEDVWARRDAGDRAQREILEALWQLSPRQANDLDGGVGVP